MSSPHNSPRKDIMSSPRSASSTPRVIERSQLCEPPQRSTSRESSFCWPAQILEENTSDSKRLEILEEELANLRELVESQLPKLQLQVDDTNQMISDIAAGRDWHERTPSGRRKLNSLSLTKKIKGARGDQDVEHGEVAREVESERAKAVDSSRSIESEIKAVDSLSASTEVAAVKQTTHRHSKMHPFHNGLSHTRSFRNDLSHRRSGDGQERIDDDYILHSKVLSQQERIDDEYILGCNDTSAKAQDTQIIVGTPAVMLEAESTAHQNCSLRSWLTKHLLIFCASDHRSIDFTLWETVLLIGCHSNRSNDFYVVLAFIANAICQSMFILIIQSSFPTSTQLDRSDLQVWRYNTGHSSLQVDALGRSLISRICAGDPTLSIARYFEDGISSIRMYHDDFLPGTASIGTSLLLLTLLVWSLLWSQEVFQTMEFQCALMKLPLGRQTFFDREEIDGEDKHSFVGISWFRLAGISAVNIFRLVVSTWLLVQGSLWLIYTPDLTEIVLNGVALAFVRDIDELLYATMTPLSFERLLCTVQPLDAPIIPKRPVFTIVLVSGFLAYVMSEIIPNNEETLGYLDDACGGNTDFVIGYHPVLDVYWSASTPSADSGTDVSDGKYAAVKEMISFSQSSEQGLDHSQLVSSRVVLAGLVDRQVYEVGNSVMLKGCTDKTSSGTPFWESAQKQVSRYSQRPASEYLSCEDFKAVCGIAKFPLVRMLCPVTCGCYATYPWSATNWGCAEKCQLEGYLPSSSMDPEEEVQVASQDQQTEYHMVRDPEYHISGEWGHCLDIAAANLTGNTPVGARWEKYWDSYEDSLTESDHLLDYHYSVKGTPKYWGMDAIDFIPVDIQREPFKEFRRQKNEAMSTGCAVISAYNLSAYFCRDSSTFQSIASYCPFTCSCHVTAWFGCPKVCTWNHYQAS